MNIKDLKVVDTMGLCLAYTLDILISTPVDSLDITVFCEFLKPARFVSWVLALARIFAILSFLPFFFKRSKDVSFHPFKGQIHFRRNKRKKKHKERKINQSHDLWDFETPFVNVRKWQTRDCCLLTKKSAAFRYLSQEVFRVFSDRAPYTKLYKNKLHWRDFKMERKKCHLQLLSMLKKTSNITVRSVQNPQWELTNRVFLTFSNLNHSLLLTF